MKPLVRRALLFSVTIPCGDMPAYQARTGAPWAAQNSRDAGPRKPWPSQRAARVMNMQFAGPPFATGCSREVGEGEGCAARPSRQSPTDSTVRPIRWEAY